MNKKPRIGLIDDQALIRKSLVRLLDAMDEFTIVFDVTNFEELQTKLTSNKVIDVLLMDIKMPDISGFDLALWMKAKFPLIIVLAVSSESDGHSIAKVMRNGARGFVDKAADPADLIFAIDTVMRGNTYLTQDDLNKFSFAMQNSLDHLDDLNPIFSDKELEFVRWACTSLSYPEIAEKMLVSANSMGDYRNSVYNKLNIRTRQELAVFAVKKNLA